MGMGLWEVFILAHVILMFAYYFAISKGKNKGSLNCLTSRRSVWSGGSREQSHQGPWSWEEGVAGAYGVCQSGWGLDASARSVVPFQR